MTIAFWLILEQTETSDSGVNKEENHANKLVQVKVLFIKIIFIAYRITVFMEDKD